MFTSFQLMANYKQAITELIKLKILRILVPLLNFKYKIQKSDFVFYLFLTVSISEQSITHRDEQLNKNQV